MMIVLRHQHQPTHPYTWTHNRVPLSDARPGLVPQLAGSNGPGSEVATGSAYPYREQSSGGYEQHLIRIVDHNSRKNLESPLEVRPRVVQAQALRHFTQASVHRGDSYMNRRQERAQRDVLRCPGRQPLGYQWDDASGLRMDHLAQLGVHRTELRGVGCPPQQAADDVRCGRQTLGGEELIVTVRHVPLGRGQIFRGLLQVLLGSPETRGERILSVTIYPRDLLHLPESPTFLGKGVMMEQRCTVYPLL